MKVKEIIASIQEWAPLILQESYDNSGLHTGDPESSIQKAMICLDITPEVIREAIKDKAGLIISHHPLIFGPVKSLAGSSLQAQCLKMAIENKISLYAVHTNLDATRNGVSFMLAGALGLDQVRVLDPASDLLIKLITFVPESHSAKVQEAMFQAGAGEIGNYHECSFLLQGTGTFKPVKQAQPFSGEKNVRSSVAEVRMEFLVESWKLEQVKQAMIKAHPYEEVAWYAQSLVNKHQDYGLGAWGTLPKPLARKDFLALVRKKLGTPVLRCSVAGPQQIRTVAVCGGSGSFLMDRAGKIGADAYITADLKYHQFFEGGDKKMLLVDAGHYETEKFAIQGLHDYLTQKFPNFATLKTRQDTNPVHYFI